MRALAARQKQAEKIPRLNFFDEFSCLAGILTELYQAANHDSHDGTIECLPARSFTCVSARTRMARHRREYLSTLQTQASHLRLSCVRNASRLSHHHMVARLMHARI